MKSVAALLSFLALPFADASETAPTRTTPPTPTSDGGTMQLRFTRFNVTANRFESRMEVSTDGGASWKPGNHQVFKRAAPDASGSAGIGLRYRRWPQPYVPLT